MNIRYVYYCMDKYERRIFWALWRTGRGSTRNAMIYMHYVAARIK